MACASLPCSARVPGVRHSTARVSHQYRLMHTCTVQAAPHGALQRQFGKCPVLLRRQTAGRKTQRACATKAAVPTWFSRTHASSANSAAASAAAARAAAVLSTPLWQHAAQSLGVVVASWAIAVTVSRWLVTNADKLEAGEVSHPLKGNGLDVTAHYVLVKITRAVTVNAVALTLTTSTLSAYW